MGNLLRLFGLAVALAVALGGGGAAARPAAIDPTPAAAAAGEIRPGELLVELRQPERAELVARRVGASVEGSAGPHVRRLRVPPGQELSRAAALRRDPEVRAVAPNYVRRAQAQPNDPFYAAQWALPKIGMPAAWDVSRGDESVAIAILDSGADLDHPDLAPKLLPGTSTLAADPFAPNNNCPSTDARDDYSAGHGTHVAGIAGGATNNALGVAGVAWQPKVIPVKVLDCTGSGSDVQVIAGLDWAVARGARIVNLSVGGPGQSDVLDAAVERAYRAGVFVIAAAGNAGTDVPYYPAASPFAFAVGATDPFDQPASFSNRGDYVAVVAPGVAILSTFPGGRYEHKSGTSMASPHVAGLAALILSLRPAWGPAELGEVIRMTAEKVPTCPPGVTACSYDANGRTPWHGFGRIDARAAACAALRGSTTRTAAQLLPPSPGRTYLPAVPRGALCL